MKPVVGFLLLLMLFGLLERLMPLRSQQQRFRPGWLTDVAHFFINHYLINAGTLVGAVLLYVLLHPLAVPAVQVAIRSQPSGLQFVEAFVLAQLIFYGVHRLAHTLPWLWRFHAIHHSSRALDWLAAARVHPLEMILVNLAVGLPLLLLGYTKASFGGYLMFATLLPIFNHANVRLRLPLVRWLIATPEFHHWHHSNDAIAHYKNFSGLPWLDLLFGTCYMPQAQVPLTYGVNESIPKTYWQQLLYPFQTGNDTVQPGS